MPPATSGLWSEQRKAFSSACLVSLVSNIAKPCSWFGSLSTPLSPSSWHTSATTSKSCVCVCVCVCVVCVVRVCVLCVCVVHVCCVCVVRVGCVCGLCVQTSCQFYLHQLHRCVCNAHYISNRTILVITTCIPITTHHNCNV